MLRLATLAAILLYATVVRAQEQPAHRALDIDPLTGLLALPWGDLEDAVAARDAGRIARTAARIGMARFALLLRASSTNIDAPRRLRAALVAVGTLAGREQLLPLVLPLARVQDENIALPALAVIGEILRDTAPDRHASWEVPVRTLQQACAGLGALAADVTRLDSVRLAALSARAHGNSLCPPLSTQLLADQNPEIRRAAVLSIPVFGRSNKTNAVTDAVMAMLDDSDPAVVSAAAAQLCRSASNPANRPIQSRGEPAGFAGREPSREGAGTRSGFPIQLSGEPAAATTLSGFPIEITLPVLVAARRFALASTASPADVVDLLGCLAASGDEGDRKLLETMARSAPPAARHAARQLLQPAR